MLLEKLDTCTNISHENGLDCHLPFGRRLFSRKRPKRTREFFFWSFTLLCSYHIALIFHIKHWYINWSGNDTTQERQDKLTVSVRRMRYTRCVIKLVANISSCLLMHRKGVFVACMSCVSHWKMIICYVLLLLRCSISCTYQKSPSV